MDGQVDENTVGWRERACAVKGRERKVSRHRRCVGDYDPSRGIVPVVLQNGGLTN